MITLLFIQAKKNMEYCGNVMKYACQKIIDLGDTTTF